MVIESGVTEWTENKIINQSGVFILSCISKMTCGIPKVLGWSTVHTFVSNTHKRWVDVKLVQKACTNYYLYKIKTCTLINI